MRRYIPCSSGTSLKTECVQDSEARSRATASCLLWKPGYSQAATYAAYPYLVINFDGNSTQPEKLIALIVHQLLHVQRIRIHLGNTRNRQFTVAGVVATRDMTGNHYVAIVPPANVVDVKSDWGRIDLNRGLSP